MMRRAPQRPPLGKPDGPQDELKAAWAAVLVVVFVIGTWLTGIAAIGFALADR